MRIAAPGAADILGERSPEEPRRLQEAARRWAPDASVRFISDTSVVRRWSDAKDATPAADPDLPD